MKGSVYFTYLKYWNINAILEMKVIESVKAYSKSIY